jgi:hypothetical protein
MRSNVHALKNRPYLPPRIRKAFESWGDLLVIAELAGLDASGRSLDRVFLGHLVAEIGGTLEDLVFLSDTGVISTKKISDWESSVAA